MKKSIFYLLLLLFTGALVSCSNEPEVADPNTSEEPNEIIDEPTEVTYLTSLGMSDSEKAVVAKNNSFAWTLFAKHLESTDENVAISPLSVSIALTMLANGTLDNSPVREEILNTLGYAGLDIKDVNAATMKLATGIERLDEEVALALANSIWVDKNGVTINPAYTDILKKDFLAEYHPIIESTYVADLNSWCEKRTNGMIKNFLSENAQVPVMALVNATYFNGKWSKDYAFEKENTVKGKFNNFDGSDSEVEYMTKTQMYGYLKTNELEAADIPFGNGNYKFVLVKPQQGYTIKECIDFFNTAKGYKFLTQMNDGKRLDLKLPKFDIDFNSERFFEILYQMGLSNALSKNDYYFAAPLTGLTVGKALHRAHLRINEDGAEAAAITFIELDVTADPSIEHTPEPPTPFHLDRPFLYLITEHETGTILFVGSINKL